MAIHPLSPDPSVSSPFLLTKQLSSDQTAPSQSNPAPAGHQASSSWDFKSGLKKLEHDYDDFDPRHAREAYLVYADGDVPKNKASKIYHYLLNVSIVTRWFLFIVPVLAILWIPGILAVTIFPGASVWGVNLLWWSVWLSIVWGGWWAGLAGSKLLYKLARSTIAVVAVNTRRYIDWAEALHRYIALFGWTIAIWVTWTPLIAYRSNAERHSRSDGVLGLIGRVLFAAWICSAVLLCEKISIQWIAEKFHERSYADRIADQKFAVKALVTLYRHSSDIPGRSDTLNKGHAHKSSVDARRLFKRFGDEVRKAATATTTALGNVASEIAGSSVLQPNSPQAMVKAALQSANKSRALARRLFYSFKKPGFEYLYLLDISTFFPPQDAQRVYALFDRDENGDISLEEMEMACLDFHKEQLSLEFSMRDLDSAVGKLDSILMSLYSIIAIVLIAVAMEAQLATIVTGTGSLVLGLSWLIGASMQEILASIIFLFVKHPYDVGDRVQINQAFYIVQEINLLSTIFIDSNSAFMQAPNNILNTLWIQNIRRSKEMCETFSLDIAYDTSFHDLEQLRDQMLDFLRSEKRDFHPIFDLTVQDLTDQSKMTVTVKIVYKSNWQYDAMRVKRRNKWVCALKTALSDMKVYGPKDVPGSYPEPTPYTQVPWEDVKAEREEKDAKKKETVEEPPPKYGWRLTDKDVTILENANDEVFGETPRASPLVSPRQGGSNERPGQITNPKEIFEMKETKRSDD